MQVSVFKSINDSTMRWYAFVFYRGKSTVLYHYVPEDISLERAIRIAKAAFDMDDLLHKTPEQFDKDYEFLADITVEEVVAEDEEEDR